MSFPFGGHPQLAEYIAWLRDEHGFNAQTGIASDASGKVRSTIRISKEGGPSLIIVGKAQQDRLEPSALRSYDRRLGVKSRWQAP